MAESVTTALSLPGQGHREVDPAEQGLGRQGEALGVHQAEGRAGVQVPSLAEVIVAAEAQLINQGSGANASAAEEAAGRTGVVAGASRLQNDDPPPASPFLIPARFRRRH